MYTVTCGLEKNALEDVIEASLALHAQGLASAAEKNTVPKFINRLSWTLHKICKYKGFSEPNFSVYGQNPRTYMGKYVSEKTCILAYFTQCEVFTLLAQKFTHYWTRIIYIILKICNCK